MTSTHAHFNFDFSFVFFFFNVELIQIFLVDIKLPLQHKEYNFFSKQG